MESHETLKPCDHEPNIGNKSIQKIANLQPAVYNNYIDYYAAERFLNNHEIVIKFIIVHHVVNIEQQSYIDR